MVSIIVYHIFRFFGCVAFVFIPKETNSKLDDRGEKCIFIDYCEHSKYYKLFNPITRKVIISRDFVFKEEDAWDGSIDKSILVGTSIPHDEEEEKDQESQDNQTNIQEGSPSRTPKREQGESSNSKIRNDSNPTLASLRPRTKEKKFKTMQEIYGQEDGIDLQSNFTLFSQDPIYYEEEIKEKYWINIVNEEIESIEKNDTLELVDFPKVKECIGVKWIYKTKFNANRDVEKHKARLVANGFAQKYGVDFNETFGLVARLNIVRMVLAIAAQYSWRVRQMNIKSTFLNGFLEEEVYVQQLKGYEVRGHEDKVYRLKKALYGLKQAPRAWYSRIDAYMIENGFKRFSNEPTLYIKKNKQGHIFIVCLYIDDLICIGDLSIDMFKSAMKKEFEMTDLGLMRYFLGIEVVQNDKVIFIFQTKYAKDVLKSFRMVNCKLASTPISTGSRLCKDDKRSKVNSTIFKRYVGSLMYLTTTRPDIMYGVSLISRFMDSPKDSH